MKQRPNNLLKSQRRNTRISLGIIHIKKKSTERGVSTIKGLEPLLCTGFWGHFCSGCCPFESDWATAQGIQTMIFQISLHYLTTDFLPKNQWTWKLLVGVWLRTGKLFIWHDIMKWDCIYGEGVDFDLLSICENSLYPRYYIYSPFDE